MNFVVGYAGNGVLSIFIAQPEVNFADDDAAPVHQFDLAVARLDLRHGIARIRIFKTVQVAIRDRAIPGVGPAAGQRAAQREDAGIVVKAVANAAATISVAGFISAVIVGTFSANFAAVPANASILPVVAHGV